MNMKKKLIGVVAIAGLLALGFAYQYGPCTAETLCVVGDLATYVSNTDWNTSIADEPAFMLDSSGRDMEFEGTTLDGNIATIAPGDPTQDITMTIPDITSGAYTFGEQIVTKSYGETVADHVSTKFFIASRSVTVLDIDAVWTTAESTGAMDVMVERLQGTEACGSGDDLQSAAIDATGTAETVNAATLTATTASLTLAAGDRLCVTLTATPNEIAGLTVSVRVRPD